MLVVARTFVRVGFINNTFTTNLKANQETSAPPYARN